MYDKLKDIIPLIKTFRGFVTHLFNFTPTSQQWNFIDEIDNIVNAKIKKNVLKLEVTEDEEYYAKVLGISVMASRGVGKDSALSLFILWFVLRFDSKLPCTAPTGTQLNSILWSEIKLLHGLIKYDCIKGLYLITNDMIRCSSSGFESFAIARASGNAGKGKQKLSGYHSKYMAICVDEASGVEGIYHELELTMTSEVNFMVLIWNPTKLSGYAYLTHYHPVLSKAWIKLHWDSYGSEIVSADSIERAKERHGENSNYFRISILGLPPKEDVSMLIPIHLARYCIDRQYNKETMITREDVKDLPITIGIDPSRSSESGCETVCCVRQGPLILEFYIPTNQIDSVLMCDEIIDKLFSKYPDFAFCFIETNSLGGPIFDILKRFDKDRIKGVNVSEKSPDEDIFNMRSWLWCQLRDAIIHKNLAIDESVGKDKAETFISQSTDIKQDFSSAKNAGKLKIKIESKISMKERGVESPDHADSVILSYYYTEQQLAMRLNSKQYKPKDAYDYAEPEPEENWLT